METCLKLICKRHQAVALARNCGYAMDCATFQPEEIQKFLQTLLQLRGVCMAAETDAQVKKARSNAHFTSFGGRFAKINGYKRHFTCVGHLPVFRRKKWLWRQQMERIIQRQGAACGNSRLNGWQATPVENSHVMLLQKQVKGEFSAGFRLSRDYRTCSEQCRQMERQPVAAAPVPGKQADGMAACGIDDNYRRINAFVLQAGRDGAYRNAAGANENMACGLVEIMAGFLRQPGAKAKQAVIRKGQLMREAFRHKEAACARWRSMRRLPGAVLQR